MTKTKAAAKIRIVCRDCGSDDVRRDATAAWSVKAQDWELCAVQDQGYCEHCQGEASLIEEPAVNPRFKLPEIEPEGERYDYQSVDALESFLSELPTAPIWKPEIEIDEEDDGYHWRDKLETGGNHGPFRNRRSAAADCLNFYAAMGFEP